MTVEDDAIARLPEHMQGDETLTNLIRVLVAPSIELRAQMDAVAIGYRLETATGVQLDAIGGWVLLSRDGRLDPEYRLWLQARLLVLRSNGRADELLHILELIVPTATERSILDLPGAAILTVAPVTDPVSLVAILNQAKAAGVRLYLLASEYPDDELFRFGAPEDYGPSAEGLDYGHLVGAYV